MFRASIAEGNMGRKTPLALTFGGMADRLAHAWRGMAERERWLLALLGLVALGGGLTTAADWNADRRQARALAAADLAARQEALVLARSRRAGADPDQLRLASERSLKGADIWMARIALEQHLATTATAAGVQTPRITVADSPEDVPPPDTLRAEIAGPYDGPAVVRLLEAVTDGSPAVFVDSLSVTGGETAEFRLALSVPVELGKAADGA